MEKGGRRSFAISRQELALVGVTMLWGATFIIIQTAMRYCGPFFFVGLRFLIAASVLALIFRKSLYGLSRRDMGAGILIGISLFIGYGLQTMGLKTIASSQSAFITALYVPMVPLLQWLFLRRSPRLGGWLGAFLAFVGLILLSNPDKTTLTFSTGELVTLIGAIAVAVEIILIGRFAPNLDSRRLTIMQLCAASLCAFLAMPATQETLPAFSWVWLIAAITLGLMTAIIQLTMNWAQKSVSPTRATIIYAGEPIWAGIIGAMAGEHFTIPALTGAVFIIAGVLVSQLLSGVGKTE